MFECCGEKCSSLGKHTGLYVCKKCGRIWMSQHVIDWRTKHGLSVSDEQREKAKQEV
jgi:hypothetical protein